MSKINLLPWREERVKEIQKKLFQLGSAFLFAIMITMIIFHYSIHKKITDLQKSLERQNKQLTHQKQVNQYLAENLKKMKLISSTEERNHKMMHFIWSLPSILPNGITLTQINILKNQISLSGIYETQEDLNQLSHLQDTKAQISKEKSHHQFTLKTALK